MGSISRKPNVRSIAIIGAGPGGIAAAKYLLAEQTFSKVDIFEQRSTVGGVWNYTPDLVDNDSLSVPQTDPFVPVEKPTWQCDGSKRQSVNGYSPHALFTSPLYDGLETNIPHFLMQYSDQAFPQGTQLFPKHETVTEYLENYAKDVRHLIQFHTQVLDVRLNPCGGVDRWIVKVQDLLTGESACPAYDAVVVANGHYNVPYIPEIKGIEQWNKEHHGRISHSRNYRNPEQYRDQKVIVVGNSASGLDIGHQISTVCRHPLIVSQRSPSYLSPGPEAYKEDVPEIEEFLLPGRAVRFLNGRVKKDIDAILFCTGYLYSYPFLRSLEPPLISDGTRTQNLYQQVFYNQHPTLAFMALPQKIIPFVISEVQAAVIARVWSGWLELPPLTRMQDWEQEIILERGAGKDFHRLGFPLEAEYLNEMHDWAMSAPRSRGLENDGIGKEPPHWGQKEMWVRERFPAIKQAFQERGEERHKVTSIEHLGFDFERWKMDSEQE